MTADAMRPSSSMRFDPTTQKSVAESLASLCPHLKPMETQAVRGDIANQPQVVNPKRKHDQVGAPKRGHRHTTPMIIPTDAPNQQEIGKQRSLMQPAAWVDMHPFAATLKEWEQGVPVDCGAPWTPEAIRLAVERGPHRSALTPAAMALIEEEIQYQTAAGFSEIVMWDDIKLNMPTNLKVSPLAVIPQKDRRGRLLLDLSFAVREQPTAKHKRRRPNSEQIIQPSVNETTTKLSPQAPLTELGRVLPRLFDFMAQVPPEETINFSKIDLSDGFWRMVVTEADKWNFAYVLPGPPGSPIRLVIPHALQMGWTESPGYFCAATETGRDILQALVDSNIPIPPHPLEGYLKPACQARRQTSRATDPWQMSAVFVDDYILAAVEDPAGELLQRTARAALHSIHAIFPPPSRSGHTGGKDPISKKKLEKDDARWAHEKEVLGFLFDGQRRTVRLSTAKANAIAAETKQLLKKPRVAIKKFRSVVGKLRHAATILPAAKSLFTPINRALRGEPTVVSIGPKSELRHALIDLRTMIMNLAQRPTHVNELVGLDLDYIGYCDASAFGAGGVWFSGKSELPPTVWRIQWPADITAAVISDSNPGGTLTNSDLEMAAVLIQQSVLDSLVPMRHKAALIHSDNTPSVSWVTKMATKAATSNAAHRLLRGLAIRQRHSESAPVSIVHIAGTDNFLADIPSRPIASLPSEHLFLTYFNSLYPFQTTSWQRATPPADLLSNVISTLRGQRLTLQRWMAPPEKQAGPGGLSIVANVESIPGSAPAPTSDKARYSWVLPPGLELDSSGKVGKLVPKWSKKPSVTWRKPGCWLDTTTLAAPTTAAVS